MYLQFQPGRSRASLCAARQGPDELRQPGYIVGTASEVKAQVDRLAQAGLQTLMLQWLDLDDLQGIQALAGAIL
jgi:hypothetical protein